MTNIFWAKDTNGLTQYHSLCIFGGVSRSLGMVSYRSIKSDVDPITVVLLHATLSCVVSVPLMGTVSLFYFRNAFFMSTVRS